MTVRELMDYLVRTNADPEATVFVETHEHRLELTEIVEDSKGIYLTSESI